MLKYANRFGIKVIGIASNKSSILLKASDIKYFTKSKRKQIFHQLFQHQVQL